MSTRDEVLEYLEKHPRSTSAQISRGLHLTAADIRHHLSGLIRAGKIDVLPAVKNERGRPARRFELTETSRPNYLPELCIALLDVLAAQEDGQIPHSLLEDIARRLLPMPRLDGTKIQQINAVVHRLQVAGYAAVWEAHQTGPVVFFQNCPYASIREGRPVLCEMDASLLSQQTGLNAEAQARMIDGAAQCIFRLLPHR
ncbi:MAG TPA: ArsR family transcriptional regulator [Anaerolineaceae bacterium]|nr:ArsR family transcriptional regulator [Anaerolineaceae bacterium]HNS36355.1 ArsR family transcriptional regulator [Anaerolineaceae bacterium]